MKKAAELLSQMPAEVTAVPSLLDLLLALLLPALLCVLMRQCVLVQPCVFVRLCVLVRPCVLMRLVCSLITQSQ